jgi:hypothetical protein
MAIDQTEKRRNLAKRSVQHAPMLMDILYALDALRAMRSTGGPGGTPLVFTDADFTGVSGLQHLDAATINAFFAAIPTLLTAFANQGFDEVFESLRP